MRKNVAIGIMRWCLANHNQLPCYKLVSDTTKLRRIKKLISLQKCDLLEHFRTHKYRYVYVLKIPGINKRYIGFADDRVCAKLNAAEAAAYNLGIEQSSVPIIHMDKIVLRDHRQAMDTILATVPNKIIICCLLDDDDAITVYTSKTYVQQREVYVYDRLLGDICVDNHKPSYKLKNAIYTPQIKDNLIMLSKQRKDLLPKIYATVHLMLHIYQQALNTNRNNQDLVLYAAAFSDIDDLLAKIIYVVVSQAACSEETKIGKIDQYMQNKGYDIWELRQYKYYLPETITHKQNRGAKEDK